MEQQNNQLLDNNGEDVGELQSNFSSDNTNERGEDDDINSIENIEDEKMPQHTSQQHNAMKAQQHNAMKSQMQKQQQQQHHQQQQQQRKLYLRYAKNDDADTLLSASNTSNFDFGRVKKRPLQKDDQSIYDQFYSSHQQQQQRPPQKQRHSNPIMSYDDDGDDNQSETYGGYGYNKEEYYRPSAQPRFRRQQQHQTRPMQQKQQVMYDNNNNQDYYDQNQQQQYYDGEDNNDGFYDQQQQQQPFQQNRANDKYSLDNFNNDPDRIRVLRATLKTTMLAQIRAWAQDAEMSGRMTDPVIAHGQELTESSSYESVQQAYRMAFASRNRESSVESTWSTFLWAAGIIKYISSQVETSDFLKSIPYSNYLVYFGKTYEYLEAQSVDIKRLIREIYEVDGPMVNFGLKTQLAASLAKVVAGSVRGVMEEENEKKHTEQAIKARLQQEMHQRSLIAQNENQLLRQQIMKQEQERAMIEQQQQQQQMIQGPQMFSVGKMLPRPAVDDDDDSDEDDALEPEYARPKDAYNGKDLSRVSQRELATMSMGYGGGGGGAVAGVSDGGGDSAPSGRRSTTDVKIDEVAKHFAEFKQAAAATAVGSKAKKGKKSKKQQQQQQNQVPEVDFNDSVSQIGVGVGVGGSQQQQEYQEVVDTSQKVTGAPSWFGDFLSVQEPPQKPVETGVPIPSTTTEDGQGRIASTSNSEINL